jgi:hypothetical protein
MLRTSASRTAAIAAAATVAGCASVAVWLTISWPSAAPVGTGAREAPPPSEARVAPPAGSDAEAAASAAADLNAPKAPELTAAKQADPRPSFDVVRIEPTGEAVIAGHFSANSAIELLVDGRQVAETTADSHGDFVIMPSAFAAGAHRLELAAKGDPATSVRSDAVAVDVPAEAAATPSPPAHAAENALRPSQEAPAIVRSVAAAPETEARKPDGASKSSPEAGSPLERSASIASRLHAPPNRARELLQLSRAAEARRSLDLLALAPPSAPATQDIAIQGGGHTSK